MIKLDGYRYAVLAENHRELVDNPVFVGITLGGATTSTTGIGRPRHWQFTLVVPDDEYPMVRTGEGTKSTLEASRAARVWPDMVLEFWDERTSQEGAKTCDVLMVTSPLDFAPIGQVLGKTKYYVDVELVEVLS